MKSFDPETGELVVDLTKGETISGLVVRRTKIHCGKGRRHHRRGHRHRKRHVASASRRDVRDIGSDRRAGEEPTGVPGKRGIEPVADQGEQGGEAGEEARGHRPGHRCNAGDLVPGAVVVRAEIVLTHGNAFYARIGLLPPQLESPAAPTSE